MVCPSLTIQTRFTQREWAAEEFCLPNSSVLFWVYHATSITATARKDTENIWKHAKFAVWILKVFNDLTWWLLQNDWALRVKKKKKKLPRCFQLQFINAPQTSRQFIFLVINSTSLVVNSPSIILFHLEICLFHTRVNKDKTDTSGLDHCVGNCPAHHWILKEPPWPLPTVCTSTTPLAQGVVTKNVSRYCPW